MFLDILDRSFWLDICFINIFSKSKLFSYLYHCLVKIVNYVSPKVYLKKAVYFFLFFEPCKIILVKSKVVHKIFYSKSCIMFISLFGLWYISVNFYIWCWLKFIFSFSFCIVYLIFLAPFSQNIMFSQEITLENLSKINWLSAVPVIASAPPQIIRH